MQGSFVSYLDYLWHDMQMRGAMNINDGSVCGGAVLNELGDHGLARPPSHLAHRPGSSSARTLSPSPAALGLHKHPQEGRVRCCVGQRGVQLPGHWPAQLGHPCSQDPPPPPSVGLRGRPCSADEVRGGRCLHAERSWLFTLLNCAPGRHSSSLRYLNYKYG